MSSLTTGEIYKKYYKKINSLNLDLILENIIKKSRSFILAHPEFKLSKYQILNLKSKIKKILKGVPLAYIIGHKEFYGLNFKVNKNVLIPRPETELIVEEALKLATHNSQLITHKEKITLIDIGTGSGCIIITLAKLLNLKFSTQGGLNLKFFATDISVKALNIAKQNAKLHQVHQKIKFLRGNLLSPIIHNSLFLIHNSDFIILANLPYLTPVQIKKSPTIQYEPRLALQAGQNGLKYYIQLLKQIKKLNSLLLAPYSLIFTILEIDPAQKQKIINIIKKELPQAKWEIKKDLRGHNRIVLIKL